MKIHKVGVVILTESNPRVEGWQVEREPGDPENATTEQLLLGYAVVWAKERFDAALKGAQMEVFREWARMQAAKLPKAN